MDKIRIFDGPDCYHWRPHFAWFPVKTINGAHVWMELVYKRHCWIAWGPGFHMEPETEYGTLFDILADETTST